VQIYVARIGVKFMVGWMICIEIRIFSELGPIERRDLGDAVNRFRFDVLAIFGKAVVAAGNLAILIARFNSTAARIFS